MATEMIKGVSLDGLTKRQKTTMKRHGEHHSAKHLKEMVKAMKKGQTFTQSHTTAMKKVGK
jgi:hypothetical protein|tara:strand:+ start:2072 stop:2254 length:183 start_codon:yes stop_codon:yes gene_type:complete